MPRTATLACAGLIWLTCATAAPPAPVPAKTGTFDERAALVIQAATADPAKLTGGNPMHFWIAQRYFELGETDKGLAIVKAGVKAGRSFIEKRVADKHENVGYNGFMYWAMLNCYSRWHHLFPKEVLDDYRYVFTTATNYKGTTGNLSLVHTLALFHADRIWGPENLPKDGRYGARGEGAVKWLHARLDATAKYGSGEFASRPYMLVNVGTLLMLDNDLVEKSLRRKAVMVYEMSLAHAAGTWLRGHWVVPAGRSYPDQLTQQPSGSAGMLWTYFGGVAPRLDAQSSAIFSAGEKFRPSPLIVRAATDRDKPYVCRSRFDGKKTFQTTFMNKTYGVFSTAVLPGGTLWPQTYPYGVMWEEPDATKASLLWLGVPIDDEKHLGYHTHGLNSRYIEYAQHRGSLLALAHNLDDGRNKYPYLLGFIPGGWKAVRNDSKTTGRVFLHYGSVLIALSASGAFEWDPRSGVRSGSPRPSDSEFRVEASHVAFGLETALPADFPGEIPEAQLDAFREAVAAKSKVALAKDGKSAAFTDRDGTRVERAFGGDTRVNGDRVEYEAWPLLDNPWMRQEYGGDLTITDGKTKRVYDVTNWTITESTTR
ncbi:Uncharacterized protein OS=Bacteroides ovatus CL03T12C18 GN=HMPREF1070_00577 PE=4 SV=1 [Gemmataceae bacterium]|nr:Uncharacterized protein OS=Bacteroides ovatus CL03T12C18 GN=HMPREF1070_00577 PE=4 SV=1 [Gemmataceae bacterium]VTU01796.1 Uncharacterized protein OS=Bacteroides ovatus CL03T12C18 GN=HMPREF1070_00577 PE=4 SV=1 [Gemmataceae bacterium]